MKMSARWPRIILIWIRERPTHRKNLGLKVKMVHEVYLSGKPCRRGFEIKDQRKIHGSFSTNL